MINKCSLCGKFRKDDELVLQFDYDGDGFCVDEWLECMCCMSDSGRETYFSKWKIHKTKTPKEGSAE